MSFFLFLTIIQCKGILADPIPTPEVYPLSVSTRIMKISGTRTCIPDDPDCPKTNFDSESTYKCGQTCWSDKNDVSFSYTFKGVQFLVYGNKSVEYNKFDLYLDGDLLCTIDEHLTEGSDNYSLLYTSEVIEYGEHTISAKGKGEKFSLFKFAFWPHLKARRLNISEMKSTGSWTIESDEIGGLREYSSKIGSSKSLTIEASKLWVYGTPDPNHGKLRVSFNTLDEIIDTSSTREDGKLLFESELLPTTFHQLNLVQAENKAILIYVVYYLYDPPTPTPMAHPSQSLHPNANLDYIDKEFIDQDVPQITDANTRQISGCKFININCGRAFFIRLNTNEMIFYNNRFEYSEASTSHAAPLFITTGIKNSMTISQCTFVNCVSSDNEGNAINNRANIDLFIKESRFVNCYVGNRQNQAVIKFNSDLNDGIGSVKFTDCTFQFSVDTESCPALYGKCPDVTFERCVFSKCSACNLAVNLRNLQFIENTVSYSSQQAISISNVIGKVNISSNSFKFNTIASNSLIVLNSDSDNSDVSINNCNFTDCKCTGENIFTIQLSVKQTSIEYCDFSFEYNNQNSANGAILSQGKGLSCKYCTFTKSYSNGAITVTQTESQTDSVTISDCIFDDCAGSNTRCFNLITYTDKLTFSNNVIKNMKANGGNSYLGLLKPNNKIESLEMKNISFIDNNCNTEYGGGIGLLIENVKEVVFNDCKFINNVATSSQRSQKPTGMTSYTSGDGGAFQYGFEKSLYEINMKFDHCLFSRNKASRHGGALAIQTVGTVEITFCTFEENIANYKVESSLNLLDNYFNLKNEGRGGAIYINPSFEYENHDHTNKYLKSVTITNCTFTSNSAFDGYAIYIEGDDQGTTFNIKGNIFTNNNGTVYFESKGIIVTEIDKFCNDIDIVDTSNIFTNQIGLNISKVSCVNHSAMPTIYYKDFDTCEPRCFASEETPEIPRFYVIKDHTANDKEDTQQDGGSAVHLENCGVSIVQSHFNKCKSLNSCGGAIYIDNNALIKNTVNINVTEFTGCVSSYGGAVYIRSTFNESPVSITKCKFTNNEATKKEGDLIGGSAIYLIAIRALIINCKFKTNIGPGGSIKIVNDFDSESKSLVLDLNRNLVVVSDSIFEIDSKPKSSSIFYQIGKFDLSKLEVKNCEFKGKLGVNSFHIDGKKMVKYSPLALIKNCRFESDYKSSLNINGNFISVNLNEQVFNYDNEKSDSSKFSLLTVVAASLLAVMALALVIVAIVVIKNIKYEKSNDNEVVDESLQVMV